jgi:GMP synthase (glutamine-hydrolysing)
MLRYDHGHEVRVSQLLLLKVGTTFQSLRSRRGDYDAWFEAAWQLGAKMRVVRVSEGEALPDIGACSGVVVTGSPSMVTDRADWSVATAEWLARAIDRLPILGVCYGHQLLGEAAGGRVLDNPLGRQLGTLHAQLTEEGKRDALLDGLVDPLIVHASHRQAVVELPAAAVRLAQSPRDPNHVFRIGERAWGVQFHPEFDADITRAYIREREATLQSEGDDPTALLAAVQETTHGTQLLRRFVALCAL